MISITIVTFFSNAETIPWRGVGTNSLPSSAFEEIEGA